MLKTQSFRGAGSRNIELATHTGIMYIPKPLHNNVIGWYHTHVMHPGATSKKGKTKHLYWPGLER